MIVFFFFFIVFPFFLSFCCLYSQTAADMWADSVNNWVRRKDAGKAGKTENDRKTKGAGSEELDASASTRVGVVERWAINRTSGKCMEQDSSEFNTSWTRGERETRESLIKAGTAECMVHPNELNGGKLSPRAKRKKKKLSGWVWVLGMSSFKLVSEWHFE